MLTAFPERVKISGKLLGWNVRSPVILKPMLFSIQKQNIWACCSRHFKILRGLIKAVHRFVQNYLQVLCLTAVRPQGNGNVLCGQMNHFPLFWITFHCYVQSSDSHPLCGVPCSSCTLNFVFYFVVFFCQHSFNLPISD